MRQLYIVLLILLATITTGFSFTLENTQGEVETYFSSNNANLDFKADNNKTLKLYYQTTNQTNSTIIELNTCEQGYCATINALNYTQNNNSIILEYNQTNNTYILDDQKPTITNLSTTINKQDQQVEMNFSPTDNSGNISFVELYKKNNNNYELVADVTNNTNYTYSIEGAQTIEYLFKIQDEAGNTNQISKTIQVDDIFKPVLESFLLTKKLDNTYTIEFSAKDNNLEEFIISQDSLFIGERVDSQQIEKQIELPFSQGTITLELTDSSNNQYRKNISLNTGVSLSSFSSMVNNELIDFSSNADKCSVTKINGEEISKEISKNNNNYREELNLDENQKNTVEFFCIKDNKKEFFSKQITVDTKDPQDVAVEIEKQKSGNLKLTWNESEDNLGNIEYKIQKNGDHILTQDDTSYTDEQVQYPNTYTYQITPVDEAGNEGSSNEVEETPLKVNVDLSLKNPEEKTLKKNSTNVFFSTEEGANVSIIVKANNSIIYEESFEATTTSQSVSIPLLLGNNIVEIKAVDEFNNSKLLTKSITYQQEQEQETQIPTTQQNNQTTQNTTAQTQPQIIQDEPENTGSDSNSQESFEWVWLLIFLALLGLFIYAFVLNEDKLRRLATRQSRKKAIYDKKRKQDEMLGKSLQRVRQKRIQKQQEEQEKKKREEELKKKQEKINTNYQAKKHQDMEKRSKKDFAIQDDNKSKKKITPKEKQPHEILEKQNREEKPSLFEQLLQKKQTPEKKQDAFTQYLAQKSRKGWSSPNDYRQASVEKQQKEQEQQKQEQNQQQVEEQNQTTQQTTSKANEKNNNSSKTKKQDKLGLDEYLSKKGKKRKFYFAEKEIEKRLNNK